MQPWDLHRHRWDIKRVRGSSGGRVAQIILETAERGCLSRSTFDNPKTRGVWQFQLTLAQFDMALGKAAEGRRPSAPSSVAGLLRRTGVAVLRRVDSPRRCARQDDS